MFVYRTLNTCHLQPTGNGTRVRGVLILPAEHACACWPGVRHQAHKPCLQAGRVACRCGPARCRAASHHPQRVHVHTQLFLVPLMCEVVTITEQELPSINLQRKVD